MVVSPSSSNLETLKGTVAILGCGLMGNGIAQVCIAHGYSVALYGRNEEKLRDAKQKIRWGLKKSAERQRKLDEAAAVDFADAQLTMLRESTSIEESVRDADIVIEAVAEDINLKMSLFTEVQKYCPKDAVLVTNTSSIRLLDMVSCIASPAHFAGLHFFNPVPLLKLVEVISTEHTSDETKHRLMEFCKEVNKMPVACKDTPGFIVNRLLVPYLIESIRMVERGDATKEDIDSAMRCGTSYPMGPLELTDYVGLDTIQNVMNVWRESMPGDSRFVPCPLLDKLVSEGKLGRKTKQGFYTY